MRGSPVIAGIPMVEDFCIGNIAVICDDAVRSRLFARSVDQAETISLTCFGADASDLF